MIGWQPIDSVPLGETVLIYSKGHMYPATAYKKNDKVYYDTDFFSKYVKPTHWHEKPYKKKLNVN